MVWCRGMLHRNKPIRVLRDDVVVFQGELESLRRYKEVVEEVRAGMECGLAVKGYKDIKGSKTRSKSMMFN